MPHVAIRLPKLGESAAEAAIVSWLVEPGATVAIDQDLLEVETEKSVMTVTSPAAGTLSQQTAAPGDRCAVGDVLGQITVADGETTLAPPESRPAAEPVPAAPTEIEHGTHFPVDAETMASVADREPANDRVPARAPGMGYFSPRVRALMDAWNLANADIAAVRGSGRAGRVSARDLEHFLDGIDEEQTTLASPMRVAVAHSMRRSWSRPLATIACDVRMGPLLAHRRSVPGRPSATVYALRALGLALKADDRCACRLIGDRLVHPRSIDLAFAVEIEQGVRTPVIQAVDTLDMPALNTAYEQALPRTREDLASQDATSIATVSNYGTFGITWSTPVPLPDQSLILGLGAVRNVPDWQPRSETWGRIRIAEMTLTFDHRVVDGGAAGRLLMKVRDLLQRPERL
ncbi:MAG: 2-oxo acid dehydrogenase subunit E2 [Planctomycetota bacterium]